MNIQHIAEIRDGTNGSPLEVRIVRKWQPFKRPETCFLLVDSKGDAIEAATAAQNTEELTKCLHLNHCYSIQNYICTGKRYTMRTVACNASIILANYKQTIPIEGENIPLYNFNFLPYDELTTRVDKKDLLTDYIGCLVAVRHSSF
ncbi:uncharacterized protein LOC143554123 [Bidens hawaiensis]|uniref:uncharacterized protein LOC143554123 n=1 Tax=Bidens hawaiensis TaxID=980011 RepID=UPI0040496465